MWKSEFGGGGLKFNWKLRMQTSFSFCSRESNGNLATLIDPPFGDNLRQSFVFWKEVNPVELEYWTASRQINNLI
jgi:hypothetical protein